MTNHILVIEDELALARSICTYLSRFDYDVDLAVTGEQGLSIYRNKKPDITLLDYQLGKIDGLHVLREIRRVDNDAYVVMMTGHGNIELAVNAMKAGARDFLTKPVPLSTIRQIVERITNSDGHTSSTQLEKSGLDAIIGRSAAVHDLKHAIEQIVVGIRKINADPPPVLITGQTGTGKELIARALHVDGPRSDHKMVSVDCAALSDNQIERLLFGYQDERGQDPSCDRPSLLKEADGGILFLDEISQLSLQLQVKLLRLLEDKCFGNLGADGEQQIDIWIISSTNRSLAALTQSGAFKKSLLFRLQALWLEAPALRHRDSDMLFLAEHFEAEDALRYGLPRRELTSEARVKLVGHKWPGNVRELRYVIERACLFATGEKIGADDIVFPEIEIFTDEALVFLPDEGLPLEAVEQKLLSQALERTRWNVSKAAKLIGLSRDQMRYRIEKFGLKHKSK